MCIKLIKKLVHSLTHEPPGYVERWCRTNF